MKKISLSIVTLFVCFALPSSHAQKLTSTTTPSRQIGTQAQYLPTETGDFRADMLAAVNAVRAQGCRCGEKQMPSVAPLRWNSDLESSASRHANDMSNHNHFSHTGTDGSDIDRRITESGYKWMEIGENIAFGYFNVGGAMTGWVKSPSHCKQMMNPRIEEIGAARSGKYWVQDFGKKRNW